MSKFSEKVRHGNVVGPRKRTFTLDGWKKAYEQLSSGDEIDTALYVSGKYIHAKLAAIRNAADQSSLSRLSTETRIKAFVAVANHQFEAIELQMMDRAADLASTDGKAELHFMELASTQVKLADGVSYNVDAVLGSMLDGIAIPVKFALAGKPNLVDDSFDDVNWNDVLLETNLGALYDQAENIWEDCVWNTYMLADVNGKMVAIPMDVDAKRGSHAAAARKIGLTIESTSYAIQAVKLMGARGLSSRIKEVQLVVTEDNQQRIELGRDELDPHGQTMIFALRTMACPPYYESLLDEAQPLLAGATLSQLLDVWMVVSQAARRLWEATSSERRPELPPPSNAVSDMSEYVPFFTKDVLVAAAHEATSIPVAGVQVIIEFLTFRGREKQEFWTQPLVSTGDPSKLYPIFGAVATPPNLRFMLERWMAQLNVKFDERGPAFEEYLRSNLVKAVETSSMLSQVAKVIPRDYTFRCADGSFGQIDTIFCVGSCVFVVEAKCILEPTESTSIGTHRSAIEHAVEQAKVRVKLIEEHREEFIADMKQFGWHLAPEFRVYPLVAVSTVAHVGVSWDGVPVVDELVLERFFAGGYEDVGLDTNDFSVALRIHRPFYANAAEAEAGAPLYFEQPPQLQQYSKALQLRSVPMYSVSADDWYGFMFDFEQG